MTSQKTLAETNTRFDSWYNAITGLGNALRDKSEKTWFCRNPVLTDNECENLYHHEDAAALICDMLPEQALARDFFVVDGNSDRTLDEDIGKHLRRLDFLPRLLDACVWSRVYGGAVLYIGLDDGMAESQPVDESKIKSIIFVTPLDKRDLTPDSYYDSLDRYGEPETYKVSQTSSSGTDALPTSTVIHESRLLRFDATRTSRRKTEAHNGWGFSVLQRPHNVIRDFGTSWQAVGHLLQDAAQGVFKIDGLVDMIASGDRDVLNTRMELVDMSRSVARAIMLDADKEDFRRESYSFGGIPDVLRLFFLRLGMAARMPTSILIGSAQGASGLNTTGESDVRLWYDQVRMYQTLTLIPALERFLHLLFAARDFGGKIPSSWRVCFERLRRLDDKEQAELEVALGQRDVAYINAGVTTAEEIALSRFRPDGFSASTRIDLKAREEIQAAEIELAKKQAGQTAPTPSAADDNEPVT